MIDLKAKLGKIKEDFQYNLKVSREAAPTAAAPIQPTTRQAAPQPPRHVCPHLQLFEERDAELDRLEAVTAELRTALHDRYGRTRSPVFSYRHRVSIPCCTSKPVIASPAHPA